MIAHWINRCNAEAITNRAVRSAAATLHHDVVLAAEINDVPNDQKISGKPELLNQVQLFLELTFHAAAHRGIALLRAKPGDRAQKRIHRVTIRHRKGWKLVADIFE